MDKRKLSELAVGMSTTRSYCFSEERVKIFSQLVDDEAPVHTDDAFAREMGFSGRIAHGLFVQAIISGMLGTELPGPYSVINQFSMKMHGPVPIGRSVSYQVSISAITPAVNAVSLTFSGSVEGDVVISGKVICSFPNRD